MIIPILHSPLHERPHPHFLVFGVFSGFLDSSLDGGDLHVGDALLLRFERFRVEALLELLQLSRHRILPLRQLDLRRHVDALLQHSRRQGLELRLGGDRGFEKYNRKILGPVSTHVTLARVTSCRSGSYFIDFNSVFANVRNSI